MFRVSKPGLSRDQSKVTKEETAPANPIPQAVLPPIPNIENVLPDHTITEDVTNEQVLPDEQDTPIERIETTQPDCFSQAKSGTDDCLQGDNRSNITTQEDIPGEETEENLVREVRENRKISAQADPLLQDILEMFPANEDHK